MTARAKRSDDERPRHWRETSFFGLAKSLTNEQATYLDAIFDPHVQLVIVDARSGTGKTTLAVGAAKLLGKPLLYVFSPVSEAAMGHRPGTQSEKENEYLQPLRDALLIVKDDPSQAIVSTDPSLAKFNDKAWVTAQSHVFARGVNIAGTTLIIDEAQNWTVHELRKVLTRCHDDVKAVVIGHSGQIDLSDPRKSGLARLIDHFADKPYARIVTLTTNFRGRLANDADEL